MVQPADHSNASRTPPATPEKMKTSKNKLGRDISTKPIGKPAPIPPPSSERASKHAEEKKISHKPSWKTRISAAVAKLFNRITKSTKDTAQPATESVKPAEHRLNDLVNNLVMLAQTDPEAAGKKLAEATIEGKELDEVVKLLMTQIKDIDTQAKIVIGASKHEIQNHKRDDPGSLLRGNAAASKLQGAFNNAHIMPLFANSSPLMQALSSLPSHMLLDQADIEKVTSDILDEIVKVLNTKDSPELEVAFTILNAVQKAANECFPSQNSGDVVALNLIFLRGVIPGITGPESKSFPVKYNGMQRDNAKYISKIIQNLVNGRKFEKEPSMAVFNDFLRQKQNVINDLKLGIFT